MYLTPNHYLNAMIHYNNDCSENDLHHNLLTSEAESKLKYLIHKSSLVILKESQYLLAGSLCLLTMMIFYSSLFWNL